MSFLNGVRSVLGLETRDSGLENPSADLVAALTAAESDGWVSASGITVTPENALRVVAVYRAVRILCDDIGTLPFQVFRRGENGARIPDEQDPRYWLLDQEPNPELTAPEYWGDFVMGHQLTWGNHYAYRELGGDGLTKHLWPLRPDRTQPHRLENGALVYSTRLNSGEEKILLADEVVHYRDFLGGSKGGLRGESRIKLARDALGVGIAAERYGSKFFSNDARPGGIIELPAEKKLTIEKFRELKAKWKAGHQGLDRSHLVAILEDGATWKDVGIPPESAQFIETRKFAVRDVARLFGLAPYKLADLESGTVSYASVEQQAIDHVVHSLRPHIVRVEKRTRAGLFNLEQDRREGRYPRFNLAALLRGDTKSRYEAYGVGRFWGWLNVDEIRAFEEMAPLPDGLGSVYLQPSTHVPAGTDLEGLRGLLIRPERTTPSPDAVELAGALREGTREREVIRVEVPAPEIRFDVQPQPAQEIRIDVAAPEPSPPAEVHVDVHVDAKGEQTAKRFVRDPDTREVIGAVDVDPAELTEPPQD
jgi:HK97 family phage portal protein